MTVFYEIVRNLLVIIITSSFLELLLPDGRVKPFVRFAIGLFVLIAILSPTLHYLYEDRDFSISFWDTAATSVNEREIEAKGASLYNEIIEQGGKEKMTEKVQGQISAVTMLVPGVENVQTSLMMNEDGSIRSMKITVETGEADTALDKANVNVFSGSERSSAREKEEMEGKILRVMQNLYGIDPNIITVEFEGG